MTEIIDQLLAADAGRAWCARHLHCEAAQLARNRHATMRNLRGGGKGDRLPLVGHTDDGRALTVVLERIVQT